MIRCLPSIKWGRVPPPYKKQARGTSPIIFLPTTYAPTFPGFSPPLAWRGRTVGISANARASIGCQQRLTRMPPPSKIVSKKGGKKPSLTTPHPRRQATDTRLAEWRQPRAIFRNVGQNLTHARRGLAGRTSKQIADGRASREEFMWWGMNQRERKDNLFYSRIMDENKQRHILSRARLEHLCHPRPTSGVTYRARGRRCSKGPLIILMMIWKCLSLCWWNIENSEKEPKMWEHSRY